MGDTGSGNLEAGVQPVVSPNMYLDQPDQLLFYRNISDRDNNGSNMGALSTSYGDGIPGSVNQQISTKFSPKVAMGQDISNVFSSQGSAQVSGAVSGVQPNLGYQGQSQQFQAFNNKLKQKKQMLGQYAPTQGVQQQ
jgi:hypothetical protein